MRTAAEVRQIARRRGWSRNAIATLITQHGIPSPQQRTEADWQRLASLLDIPHPVGSIVHKQHHHGWGGVVTRVVSPQSVEVHWWGDEYPTLVRVDGLRSADDAIAGRYTRAFTEKGVLAL
ncbi:hypothetical protein GS597_01265 [Synechococcales cyanobacterium C]|uniref:Uncharacterized protein n=1 Tax=Petrachloros mirabilis ULC683 TaxID=2781853 RepID=A0A8K1ZWI9_9CYAN|nr:hypothetical protein [Petrachloros mirabilis]NCJ05168.1 hypothetical protein [Petrachloros mirabilis ULC683]